ncbi:MAG: HAD hydrolase-like protein, partial [Burkholderiales bacterium]
MADRSLRLLLFDFDGTLVDSQRIIVAAMREAFAGARLAAPEVALVKRVVGLTLETAVARLLPPDSEGTLAARLAGHYRQAFFRLRQDPAYHEPLYPGAAETLLALDRPPVRLGIATGKSRRGLMAVLE